MVTINEGRTIEYKTAPRVHIDFPEKAPDTLEEINLRVIKELVHNFTSEEAKGACEEIVKKYPSMYFDVFMKEFTVKAAKLEAIKNIL